MQYQKLMLLLIGLLAVNSSSVWAQTTNGAENAQVSTSMGDIQIKLQYDNPAVDGREIWGTVVPYGERWNSRAVFEIGSAVKIEGKELAAGKYALYFLPNKDSWTFIFNSDHEAAGTTSYDPEKDILRIDVKPGEAKSFTENLTYEIFTKGHQAGFVLFRWEELGVGFNITRVQ